MLTPEKIAQDRRNAFMLGARKFINTKLASEDRADAAAVIKHAVTTADALNERLLLGNSRERLQLKAALARQGISV